MSYVVATNDATKHRRSRVEKRHATKTKTMKTIDSFKMIVIAWAAALFVQAYSLAYAQQEQALAPAAANEEASPIPADQLDSLVAPIALYPDPLLAQTLAASTYPLEVIQLEQWYVNNKYLKDKALADAVAKQPWDPSVQALVAFPDVFQRMAGNIQWTTDLGNAFLAQQSDVMDAIQRMRAKAQGTGNLKTNAQQKVETETAEGGQQMIVIEQTNPDVVYVPSYDPQMVYGAAPPAYPYYPYTYPGYYAGMGLAFGTGLVLGGIWANNNWGNCDWKHGNVNINNNNNFNRNVTRNVNRGTVTGQGNTWQHNPQHRGNAPYGNRQTANRYGGTARGEAGSLGAGARGGGGAGALPGTGVGARSVGSGISGGNRTGGGGAQNIGAANRPGSGVAGNISAANRPGVGAGANRAGGGAAAMPASRGGGANGIGNRSVSSGAGFGSSSNAFGGSGFNGSAARSAGNRGGASMGGGGFSRSGSGGGARGGGGARRR
jgi:uncharacterized protein DUF3300